MGEEPYFLKKFVWFKSTIGVVFSLFPILANLGNLESKGVVPPLGYDYLSLYVFLLMLVLLASYSLRYIRNFIELKWLSTIIVILFLALSLISFFAYVGWQQRVVRCGEIRPVNSKPTMECVIIGTERTAYTNKQFKNWTDEEILNKRGWTDEQVRKIWDPKSISEARKRVVSYYLLIPILLIGALGVIVVRECIDDGWK